MNRPKPAATGDFQKTPLAHLLIYALEKKLTGSLEFAAPDGRSAALTIIEGHATNARTSDPVAHLGRVLADLGFLTDEALNRSLLLVAQTKRLHGQILIEQRLVTPDQLKEGLRVQLLRKLRHMFTLPSESSFSFYDAFDVLHGYGGDIAFTTDPLPVIWRAVCEEPPWEHVHGTLSRMQNSRLRLASGAALERFDFEKDVLVVLDRLRAQPMRMSELTGLGVLSPRMTQLLAYTLLITKQIKAMDPVTTVAPPPAQRAVSVPPPPPTPHASPVRGGTPAVAHPAVHPPPARAADTGPMPTREKSSPAFTPAPSASSPLPKAGSVPSFSQRAASPSPRGNSAPQGTPAAGTVSRHAGAPSEHVPLSPEHTTRRNEIKARAATIDKQDYFEMLGVKRDATPEEIQGAFFALAKKWHPDRLQKELEQVRDECQRVFARFGEAHQTLMDPERRQRYMRLLAEGGATPDEQETIAAVIDAAQNFQKAEVYMKRNDLAQAEMLCRKAYEADRQQPDYLALLAWLEAMKPENQSPKATLERIAMLDRAVQLSDNCERAFFYRGMLHKKLQNAAPAMRDFRRAAELNPRNVDAAREVRLFEMRKGRGSTAPPPSNGSNAPQSTRSPQRNSSPPQESKGILGKLFKK